MNTSSCTAPFFNKREVLCGRRIVGSNRVTVRLDPSGLQGPGTSKQDRRKSERRERDAGKDSEVDFGLVSLSSQCACSFTVV